MKYLDLLASYLPSVIVEELVNEVDDDESANKHHDQGPRRTTYETACFFADVSGFTNLSEEMTRRHGQHVGAEYLAKHLNSYFSQLVKIIGSEGGDVFKFAGDAMIVLWPPNEDEDLVNRTRRAAQCATRVMQLGQDLEFDDAKLSIKIGIGVGSLSILKVGGIMDRTEYIAVGEPMMQAFAAEGMADPGDVVLSSESWELINKYFKASQRLSGEQETKENPYTEFFLLDTEHTGTTKALRKRNKHFGGNRLDALSSVHEKKIRNLIPAAALQSIDFEHPEFEVYSSELRRVSVLFINLGFSNAEIMNAATGDEELMRIHHALEIAQSSVYKFEGALNKFLLDDKGATMIMVFGLPPFSHENDPKRAVSCSMHMIQSLTDDLSLNAAIGVTTGTAFCGVIGGQMRKEYSVLGDIVNVSARLMQASKKAGPCHIFCDVVTFQASSRDIPFRVLGSIPVKGKSEPIEIFEPLMQVNDGPGGLLVSKNPGLMGRANGSGVHSTMGSKMKKNGSTPARYTSIEVIASERLAIATHTRANDEARAQEVGLYFKGDKTTDLDLRKTGKTLKGISSGVNPKQLSGDKGNKKGKKGDSAKKSVASSKSRSSRGTKGTKGGLFRKKKKKKGSRSNGTGRMSGLFGGDQAGSQVSSTHGMSSAFDEMGEFAFDFQEISTKLGQDSQSSFADGLDHPNPRRQSLIFYNNPLNSMVAESQTVLHMTPEERVEVVGQAMVGSPNLFKIKRLDRSKVKHCSKLLDVTLPIAKASGMLRHESDPSQFVYLIQGTEIALDLSLWPSAKEYVKAKVTGEGAPSIGMPSKYIEPIVNEALANGEMRFDDQSPPPGPHMLETSSSGKGSKFWASGSGRALGSGRAMGSGRGTFPAASGASPSVSISGLSKFSDESGNGGTSLKLVMVAKEDLPMIQSSGSRILQTLMYSKIELMEHSKGSVHVISGDPGSGKTHIMRRFSLGFMPSTVPVYYSSERWDHTTSEFETDYMNYMADQGQWNTKSSSVQRSFSNTNRSFSVWFDVISQWVFFETRDNKPSEMTKARTDLIRDVLSTASRPYASLLNEDLGTNFMTPIGAAAQALGLLSTSDHNEQVSGMIASMIIQIIAHIAGKNDGLLLCFDDCLRLDACSWHVATKLAQMITEDQIEVMLVFASRPFEGIVDRSLGLKPALLSHRTRHALGAYRLLCRQDIVSYSYLGPLSNHVASEIFRKSVGENIAYVTPDLWDLCETRCFNNPLLIKEFAFEIRNARRPKVVKYIPLHHKKKPTATPGKFDPSAKYIASLRVAVQNLDEPAWVVHAAHKAASSKQSAFLASIAGFGNGPLGPAAMPSNVADGSSLEEGGGDRFRFSPDMYPPSEVPPPATAAGVLGARIDRLAPIEQLVLKIACVVGNIFSLRQIEDVYPFTRESTRKEVMAACEALANQHGILHKIRANAYNDEYVYRFSDLLLVSTLRHRLQSKHKLSLAAKISRARNQYKAALELADLAEFNDSSRSVATTLGRPGNRDTRRVKEGVLSLKKKEAKNFSSDWKERFVILHDDSMLLFKRKDPRRNGEVDAHEAIFFSESTVRLDDEEARLAFVVEATEWSRRGEYSYLPRSFRFSGPTEDETRRWFSRVSMVINKYKLGALIPQNAKGTTSARMHGSIDTTHLLPIRRRTDKDYNAILDEKSETAVIITLQKAAREQESGRPSLTEQGGNGSRMLAKARRESSGAAEIYVSIMLNMQHGEQLVRKQTTLLLPQSSSLLDIQESFVFALAPEAFVDWSELGDVQGQPNATLEFVLWRQQDGALGYDRMLGCCSIPLHSLIPAKTGVGEMGGQFNRRMEIVEPYNPIQVIESMLHVRFQLVVSKPDRSAILAMRSEAASDMNKDDILEKRHLKELARQIFSVNKRLELRAEASDIAKRGTNHSHNRYSVLRTLENNSREHSGSTVSKASLALRRNLPRKSKARSVRYTAESEKVRANSDNALEVGRSTLTNSRVTGAGPAKHYRRRSSPEMVMNMGPLDSTLAHLDFVMQQASCDDEMDELDTLKQKLLTRSFTDMMDAVQLDDTARRWLGTEFTRDDVALYSIDENGMQLTESHTRTMEEYMNAYVIASSKLLSYGQHQVEGLYGLGHFTGRLQKGEIDEDLIVCLHDIFIDEDIDPEDEANIEPLETLRLGEYLERLEILLRKASHATQEVRMTVRRTGTQAPKGLRLTQAILKRSTSVGSLPSGTLLTSKSRKKKKQTWTGLEDQYRKLVKQKTKGLKDARTADCSEWRFDLSLIPASMRAGMVASMFNDLALPETFSIPVEKFAVFVDNVEAKMSLHDAPYHNFDHACDVIQATFVMLGRMGGSRFLTEIQVFGLLVAAFCHDLEHPGLNNAYQVKAKTALALEYEDSSVLESHHSARAIELLRDDSANIMVKLDELEAEQLRQVIVETILATDMTCHFDLTGELRNCMVRNYDRISDAGTMGKIDMDEDDRLIIAKTILHCADISNPSRSWTVAKRWQDLVTEEFFRQGDLEKANGWPCSANMDRETTHQDELSINFIDFIVAPLFLELASVLPQASEPCSLICSNREQWAKLLERRLKVQPNMAAEEVTKALASWQKRAQAFDEKLVAAGLIRKPTGSLHFSGTDPSMIRSTTAGRKTVSGGQPRSLLKTTKA
ncbi:3' [Durusdinium trenchii]|uniref:Phosphodiesterase n=1 Tax=Durusdinium trenchii TaxID=1381693 RepID=A0ABP0NCV3_9DINO